MIATDGLLLNLIIVLGSTTTVVIVAHLLKFTPLVGFLIAGVLVGPYGFKLISSQVEIATLVEISSVLLLFTLGLEFTWRKVLSVRQLLINLGLAQVLLTTLVVSFITHQVWRLPWSRSVLIGVLVAMSSTAVVLKILHEQRRLDSPIGKASLGILASQDLFVLFFVVMMPLLAESSTIGINFFTWSDFGNLALRFFLVVFLLTLGTRYFIPQLFELVKRTKNHEVRFFAALFVCVAIAMLLQQLGLPLSLSAFCVGVMVSESFDVRKAALDFTPLRDHFLGIFFVTIGMLLNLVFLQHEWLAIFGYLVLIVLLKVTVIGVLMRLMGRPIKLALATGLMLAQVGEFSFILVDQGSRFGVLDERGRQLFYALSILSLAITPVLYRLALSLGDWPGRRAAKALT